MPQKPPRIRRARPLLAAGGLGAILTFGCDNQPLGNLRPPPPVDMAVPDDGPFGNLRAPIDIAVPDDGPFGNLMPPVDMAVPDDPGDGGVDDGDTGDGGTD